MKISRLLSLLTVCCLVPGIVLAHAKLTEATPANGSVIKTAPVELELGFSEEVQLLKLAISGIDSKLIPTSFKPSATASTSFSVPLPELDEDAYVVAYTILGKDGHQVEDKLTFVVNASEEQNAESPAAPHAEHGQ